LSSHYLPVNNDWGVQIYGKPLFTVTLAFLALCMQCNVQTDILRRQPTGSIC